jgi:hypothetical protein
VLAVLWLITSYLKSKDNSEENKNEL